MELEDSIKGSVEKFAQTGTAPFCVPCMPGTATAVVPVTGGICSGCGVALPTPRRPMKLHVTKEIMQCPRCARIIYPRGGLPASAQADLKAHRKAVSRNSSFFLRQLMIPNLKQNRVKRALNELIGIMADEGFIEDPKTLLTAALNREAIVPTAVEHGLAFPHVRGVEGGGTRFFPWAQKSRA